VLPQIYYTVLGLAVRPVGPQFIRRRIHVHSPVRGDNLTVDHLHPRTIVFLLIADGGISGWLYGLLVVAVALWLVIEFLRVVVIMVLEESRCRPLYVEHRVVIRDDCSDGPSHSEVELTVIFLYHRYILSLGYLIM
jgi:hypothetical protein